MLIGAWEIRCARTDGLEVRVSTPIEGYRGGLDLQAGAEQGFHTVSIIHDQLRALPPACQIEVALPLPKVNHLGFEETKCHQAAFRAAPAAIDRAAQFQAL